MLCNLFRGGAMDDSPLLKICVLPVWDCIGGVREKTEDLLKGYDKDLVSDTLMVVTELMENAVKYGMANTAGNMIDFELADKGKRIVIKVSNRVKLKEDTRQLTEIVDQISSSQDPAGLYISRMKELVNNSNPGKTQLGLYRIAYEGEFLLGYEWHGDIITISAVREFK